MEYINLDFTSGSQAPIKISKGTENYYKLIFNCPKNWTGKKVAYFFNKTNWEYIPIPSNRCMLPNKFKNDDSINVRVYVVDGESKFKSSTLLINQM